MQCRLRNCWLRTRPEFIRSVSALAQATVLLVLMSGCSNHPGESVAANPEPVNIAVTSYPLFQMTESLAGDAASVTFVIDPPDTSPHWKPTTAAVQLMQQATRILISGGDYEPWLQRVTLPRSRLIDTADGYYDQFIRIPDAVVHQHGPDGAHSHGGVVWATWLDPQLAMSQVTRIRDVLTELCPEALSGIQTRAESMLQALARLDEQLDALKSSTGDRSVTVLGDAPVYNYLARRLEWSLTYIHLPREGPLSEEHLQTLNDAVAQHQPAVVLLRRTLYESSPGLAGQISTSIAVVDLCENPVDDVSLTDRLAANLHSLKAAVDADN